MNYDIQCYLQKDDGTSAAINTKSLCQGMYVLEAKGLADYGKAKNIVTESYAEGDSLRAYIPSDGVIKREATDVSLKLLFLDEGSDGRYQQYDTFIAYMKSNIVFYWDSVRKRKARLLFVEKSSPEEHFKGSLPYIEATVKFKNLKNNQIAQYQIVGVDEANITKGKISFLSPLSKVLMNKKAGETVSFNTPQGEMRMEILSIS